MLGLGLMKLQGKSFRTWLLKRRDSPHFDIVAFWITRAPKYPKLAKIVIFLMSIPVASSRLESAFSSMNHAMGDRRHAMGDNLHRAAAAYAMSGDAAGRFAKPSPMA